MTAERFVRWLILLAIPGAMALGLRTPAPAPGYTRYAHTHATPTATVSANPADWPKCDGVTMFQGPCR